MKTYRIVVGVDGSPSGARALHWAAEQARVHHGTVQAMSVYDWAGTEAALLAGLGPDGERRRAEDIVNAAVADVRQEFPDVAIAAEAVLGSPGRKLSEAAADADLLVVGSHGRGRLHSAVLGSVAEFCVRRSLRPVVVVPAPHPQSQATTEVVERFAAN
ncbi:MAG: universal stress protein [Hamadaea sp.]|uniref:universal stress protein n=1 Tax=Hamadaea sp. TaxID=2024425 RepID=UPI0018307E7B|nr:universal stress protein [Hamadaea sp.]NUT18867.1 universal stress protein [Hamadaea sp.]